MRTVYTYKFLVLLLMLAVGRSASATDMMIDISAGDDATICYGSYLDMNTLGAYISGDVDDGIWFTSGDGIFLPSGSDSQTFSTATYYQPGPSDLNLGEFELILVSDDPDGQGPMVEVSDNVLVTLMSTPALVCNTAINVSLSETCEQAIDIFMLMANPQPPFDMYIITTYDEAGDTIPNNVLQSQHVGQAMTYVVGHECSANTCNGVLTASDNIAPFLNCLDATVSCSESAEPENTGLPIPFFASAIYIGDDTYTVTNFDACGEVTLTFDDDQQAANCINGLESTIDRTWTAVDVHGNMHSCLQHIQVTIGTLADVVPPPNYNNIDEPALECDGDWDALPDGHPAPSTTGEPSYSGCSNMQANFTDLYFDECGASFKIIRQWVVIDWCTSQTENINQTIKIQDSNGPSFACPNDTIIGTDVYSCTNAPYTVMLAAAVMDCSAWEYTIQVLDANGIDQTAAYVDGLILQHMAAGNYTLVYVITDECNNATYCETSLTVVDDTEPFAICDQYTVASLTSSGTARVYAITLDDESYDNCELTTMEVQKMTDQCGVAPSWASYIDFCCEELGDTVMVQFRVTDASGLSNTCMVEVRVEDKLTPELTCPSDMTISCGYHIDEDDLDQFGVVRSSESEVQSVYIDGQYMGTDGFYQENCTATLSSTHTMTLDCGAGSIVRTFTVTDGDGGTASCQQTITIVNDQFMTEADIIWPANSVTNGCDTLQAAPTITGVPMVLGEHCADPATSYDDQIFYISGGACVKILRYWSVIDWCQYDGNTGEGLWQYIQEIKLHNDIAPIIANCQDVTACDYDDCGSHQLRLGVFATDDCTAAEHLQYSWSLDLDDDSTIDYTGTTDSIHQVVPYGVHRVSWTVHDGCTNGTTCSYLVTVKDCKLPTPYCLGSVVTTIMPSAGEIEIAVTDFDLGATDNCTETDDLVFSFSNDTTDITRVLTCGDIPNGVATQIELQIWVTDLAGNQDYCTVYLILQDNADGCPDGTVKGELRGTIYTATGEVLPSPEVAYHTIIDSYGGQVTGSAAGQYHIDSLPQFLSYGIKPAFAGGPKGDINVLDIIAIQRHILQLDTIQSPYDLIAADVTGNDRVQASDLLAIKRYILGVTNGLPRVPKWKFIPADYVFPDAYDPFDYVDSLAIDLLIEDQDSLDFIAIRMGNIRDGNTLGIDNDGAIESRSLSKVTITATQVADGGEAVDLFLPSDVHYDGLQLSLEAVGGTIVDFESPFLDHSDYHISDGKLTILSTDGELLERADHYVGRVVLTGGELAVTEQENRSIIAAGETVSHLVIAYEEHPTGPTRDVVQVQAVQNPFSGDLMLSTGDTGQALHLAVINSAGTVLHEGAYDSEQGIIRLSATRFPMAGVYYIRVVRLGVATTIKVVKI